MQKCIVINVNESHLGVNPEKDINRAIASESKEGFKLSNLQVDCERGNVFLIFEKI